MRDKNILTGTWLCYSFWPAQLLQGEGDQRFSAVRGQMLSPSRGILGYLPSPKRPLHRSRASTALYTAAASAFGALVFGMLSNWPLGCFVIDLWDAPWFGRSHAFQQHDLSNDDGDVVLKNDHLRYGSVHKGSWLLLTEKKER